MPAKSLIYILWIYTCSWLCEYTEPVYKSLDVDVGTPYFSTITNFVIEMTLGHVVTVPLGHVVTLLQWSR